MTIRAIYRSGGLVTRATPLDDGVYSLIDKRDSGWRLPFKVEGDKVTFPLSKLRDGEGIKDDSFTGNVYERENGGVIFEGPGDGIMHHVDLTVERHDEPINGVRSAFGFEVHRYSIRRER